MNSETKEQQPEEHQTMAHQSFFRKWGGLVVLSLALAIIIIDTTLLNVSLRPIINDLHTNLHSMQWVITIYSLILAAFTITGGRLGDLFGRKKMFLLGAIIFAAGSFLASISKGIGMMVAGEAIIEGVGAALMMPATASLLITNYKGRDRAVAFGVWGGIAAAASAIGPILGGWLTTNYSWRWGFRINIFVVALVLIFSFLIRENHALRRRARMDLVGVALSSLGLLSLVFGFIQASSFGWFKVKEALVVFHNPINLGSVSATPFFIALGLIILTIFLFWERRMEKQGKTPLVSLHLFQNRQFIIGASTMGILALGQAGLFFTIPVFLQAVRRFDALHTGLALLPLSLTLLVAAPLSAVLAKYVSPKRLVQAGIAFSALSFFVMHQSLGIDSTTWSLAPGFILFGFGMGLMMAQISNLTLSAVPQQDAGEASGVNNTIRMVGQTLGSAILGAILLSSIGSNVVEGINDSKVIPDQAKQQISTGVSEHLSDISFGSGENPAQNLPLVIRNEIALITNHGVVGANKTVMVYSLLFVLLGLLVSFRLPNSHPNHGEDEQHKPEPSSEEIPEEPIAMAAVEETERKKPRFKFNWKQNWKMYVPAFVVILALIGAVVWANSNSKNDNENSNNPPQVVIYNSNNTTTPNPPDLNSNTNAPAETPPVTTPPAPATYTSQTFHFSFAMPSDWKVVKENGEVVFQSPAGLYNVQSYNSTGDMNQLKSFLESQNNIHNITAKKFGGYDAYQFSIDGSYVSGYAFLSSGRLYYVLGVGSENTPLTQMTTF